MAASDLPQPEELQEARRRAAIERWNLLRALARWVRARWRRQPAASTMRKSRSTASPSALSAAR